VRDEKVVIVTYERLHARLESGDERAYCVAAEAIRASDGTP